MRVVLDTNVVLSALLFAEGRVAWIRTAWKECALTPIVCRETVTELIRVLAYPKFELTQDEQRQLLADYLPFAETHSMDGKRLPRQRKQACRDPGDEVFLRLAGSAKAAALVTGDEDLLSMAKTGEINIVSPEQLRGLLKNC